MCADTLTGSSPAAIRYINQFFHNHTSLKEQFMHSAERQAPAEMNWVDYCDSLSNAKFVQHAKVPPSPFTANDIPDHTAFVASVREAMRDLK
jgi:hypothetical protein